MTLLVDTPTAGLPQIQRAALYVLRDTLNIALGEIETAWAASDEEFANDFDREYTPIVLERVALIDFHEGFRPSLIRSPKERIPNVSVMCYRATPGAASALNDHMDIYNVPLVIETMLKASAAEGEEILERRAHRMVEAIMACMSRNQTLGGIVSGLSTNPTSNLTEMFPRKDSGKGNTRTAYGQEWLWQGGRIEYTVRKEAATPSHGSAFRSVQHDDLGIDQV